MFCWALGCAAGWDPAAVASQTRPAAPDVLRRCVQRAVPLFQDMGAVARSRQTVGFVAEGRSVSVPVPIYRQGCVGVLAVGYAQARGLNLVLYAVDGTVVARSEEQHRYQYAHYCGAAGTQLVAVLSVAEGQSEYRLVALDRAPAMPPNLVGEVGECFAPVAGSQNVLVPDIGPEPVVLSAAEMTASANRRMRELGYRHTSDFFTGSVREQRSQGHVFSPQAGMCYGLAAVPTSGYGDIDVVVRRASGEVAAMDATRERFAHVRWCVETDEPMLVEVHGYHDAQQYTVHVYEQDPRETVSGGPQATTSATAIRSTRQPRDQASWWPFPEGVDASMRVSYLQVLAGLRARGLTTRTLVWGYVEAGQPLSVPIRLRQGTCYAFSALPSAEFAQGDLDLSLVSRRGELVAWDVNTGSTPTVFHCPTRTADYRAITHAYGGRGMFVLLLSEDQRAL